MINNQKTIYIRPTKVAIVLGCISGILVLINLIDHLNTYLLDLPVTLIPQFHLDENNTISTYFLTILLALSSLMLAMIGAVIRKRRKQFSRYWMGLAIIFLSFSIDEVANIHEYFRSYTTNIRYRFTWIIPVITCALAFLFIRFLLHLSSPDRKVFLLATILFLGGAVGMDYLDGLYYYISGENTLTYRIMTTFESGLEMFGSVMYVYALLNYMSRNRINITIKDNSQKLIIDG